MVLCKVAVGKIESNLILNQIVFFSGKSPVTSTKPQHSASKLLRSTLTVSTSAVNCLEGLISGINRYYCYIIYLLC